MVSDKKCRARRKLCEKNHDLIWIFRLNQSETEDNSKINIEIFDLSLNPQIFNHLEELSVELSCLYSLQDTVTFIVPFKERIS